MKVKCLSYKRIFPVAQYINETIGIEVELEEGDDPDAIFDHIKAKVNDWGAEKSNYELVDRNPPLPVQQVAAPKAVVDKEGGVTLEEQIRSCKTLSVLGIYEKIIDKQKDAKEKTRLWLVYDEVYASLTKQEVTA